MDDQMIRQMAWRTSWLWLLLGGAIGCTTMATVTNVRDQPCQQNVASALSEILLASC
jgi:bacteriorhodopsin